MTAWAILALTAALAAADAEPARLTAGRAPVVSGPTLVGGGEVLLDVTVDPAGRVANIEPLRGASPFTEAMTRAVGRWRFTAARRGGEPAEAHVLVAGVFRPPTLLGPAPGEPARELGSPSADLPFPTTIVPPAYPPNAQGDAAVLLEVEVGQDGAPGTPRVVQSAAGFDGSAIDALVQWRFRPSHAGRALAYVVLGFRQPVLPPPPPARPR